MTTLFLSASVALAVIYFRKWKASETKSQTLAHLPKQLEETQEDNRALRTELDGLLSQASEVNLDLRQALSSLDAFSENLPKNSDIEEKFVIRYHAILTSIEKETGHNLETFRIQSSEVAHHISTSYSRRRGGGFVFTTVPHTRQSEHRYCDKEVFRMRLHGLIKFLADL